MISKQQYTLLLVVESMVVTLLCKVFFCFCGCHGAEQVKKMKFIKMF